MAAAKTATSKTAKPRQVRAKSPYRSQLEERVIKDLARTCPPGWVYEDRSRLVEYRVPESVHHYLPDVYLPNGIIIEIKGEFARDDRKKHLYIKEQHPELDIRFVFGNPNWPINPGSKTTYAKWCDENGFKWASRAVPIEWTLENMTPKKSRRKTKIKSEE